VAVGTWAVAKMGWARLLFAGALFPPGAGAEENNVPQRLVLEGPYRYMRNPLYDTDFALILGTALLTSNWFLVLLAVLYVAQLALQLPLEERELRQRFGRPYRRYCEVVPRFVPRLRPVSRRELE
jgi:protein-S-isoprenylcysteine O-methyltransferase Ste14